MMMDLGIKPGNWRRAEADTLVDPATPSQERGSETGPLRAAGRPGM